MALTKTPICDFNLHAIDFKLKSVGNTVLSLSDIKGENGTLIMFICNHCPYVKAIIRYLVEDCEKLKDLCINSAAMMSNDTIKYPDESYEKMKKYSAKHKYRLPYLIEETQEIAK